MKRHPIEGERYVIEYVDRDTRDKRVVRREIAFVTDASTEPIYNDVYPEAGYMLLGTDWTSVYHVRDEVVLISHISLREYDDGRKTLHQMNDVREMKAT